MTITPDALTAESWSRNDDPDPVRAGEPFLIGEGGLFPLVADPRDAPTAYVFGPQERAGRRRGRTVLALLASMVVIGAVGYQAWQLDRLGARLEAAQRSAEQSVADREQRAADEQERLGREFDSEAVAASVLPSVFRVRAGRLTGTAFAVGAPADGGTNLITNFHVVEAVWNTGDRKVTLERGRDRVAARITAVDKDADLAQLRAEKPIAGLDVATASVRPGQQILVAGAPLGLEDSVTTGVVSALRNGDGVDRPLVQVDAPINPGNSGGPVVNADREVVGITTAKARDAEGIGLAIPIMAACAKLDAC